MSLPWDELQPEDEPEPPPPPPAPVRPPEDTYEETEVPYRPPVNLPDRVGDVDFGKILKDAFSDALVEAGEKLRTGAKDYAKESWEGIRKGESVDILHPTITAETSKGKQLIVADAKSRSWRTLLQGLTVDVIFAVVAAFALITDQDPFVKETWIFMGIMILKSVMSAIVSYFMRLKVTPTIRTPGEKMAMMPVPRPMIDEDAQQEWEKRSA